MQTLLEAATTYRKRQNRSEHPDGEFDKKQRWYPSEEERQSCCRGVRNPSAAWPFSLIKHCRSAEHVANLYGVDVPDLKRTLYLLDHYPTWQVSSLLEVIAAAERLDGKRLSTARIATLARKLDHSLVAEEEVAS